MKKLTIILGILILATTAFFLFKPQPIGTGTRTKMVYLDRENTFTATTTLENGFVSTSTPTQAGQIVGLDGDGKLPAVDGSNLTNNFFIASDNAISTSSSANTEKTTNQSSYTKVKEIAILVPGTYIVSFDMKEEASDANAFGRLYKNGIAIGIERQSNSSSYLTYTESVTLSSGDLLQLYIKTANVSRTCYVKNLNLKFYIGPAKQTSQIIID